MRDQQIKFLFNRADNLLTRLKVRYQANVDDRNISDNEFKIEILFFLVCLRVILDYLAKDIADKYSIIPEKKEWIKFPIHGTKKKFEELHFAKEIKNNNTDLYDYLLSIQPTPENGENKKWLSDFNNLVNNNKHDQLSPHKIEQNESVAIGGYKFASIITCNTDQSVLKDSEGKVLVGSNQYVRPDNIEDLKNHGGISPDFKKEIWDSIRFKNADEDIIIFLEKVFSNIKEIRNEIYQKIGLVK